MTIGLTYDLRDDYLAEGYTEEQVAEFDSRTTIDALDAAITSLGYRADRIGNGRALCRRLAAGERWELVFNIAEGAKGRCREAQVPALLELYDIPYTMSDPLVCAVTLDKAMTKRLVQAAGVRTPAFALIGAPGELSAVNLGYPLFAKPVAEGTGKGVDSRSRVGNAAELAATVTRLLGQFAQPVLVEEYLPGREFTTGLLGTGNAARVLGTMEVCILAHAPTRDYSFEVKEKCESLVKYQPLEPGALRREAEELALRAYRALECRDCGRIDIRLDREGRPAFIVVNPLPGLHPTHSDLPMIAAQEGMAYRDLLGAIIASALSRYPRRA